MPSSELQIEGYSPLAMIAEGGMSRVFKARRHQDGAIVALKIPKPDTLDDEGIRRFLATARRWLSVGKHPHIARAIATVGTEELPVLEMEFIEGPTLAEKLLHGPLTIVEAVSIASQIADALGTVHDSGLIHRDLKPANIILAVDGAKLVDFGIAVRSPDQTVSDTTRITGTGVVVGTPGYMSPEQADGHKDLSAASDVFVLGTVIFEMLTGQPPFSGRDSWEVLRKVADPRMQAPSVSSMRSGIPAALDSVVAECLRKDRTLRPRTMHEIQERLSAMAHGTSAVPMPASRARTTEVDLTKRILGRREAVSATEAALKSLMAGTGSILVLSGEMGIGKKRIAREAAIAARSTGALVLRGACSRPERRSYRPLYQALSAWCRERRIRSRQELSITLSQISPQMSGWSDLLGSFLHLPGNRPTDQREEGPGLIDALEAFFLSLSEIQPVLLNLEGIDRSDEGTLDLLRYLAPVVLERPFLVIASYQSDSASPGTTELLQSLRMEQAVRWVEVGRLSESECIQLIEQRYPGIEDDPELTHRLHVLSAGNPYYLLSALDQLAASDQLVLKGDRWRLEGDLSLSLLPDGLLDLMQIRIQKLSPEDRAVFEAAALAAGPGNREMDAELLSEVLDRKSGDTRLSLGRLATDHHLLSTDRGQFTLVHPSLHEVVVCLMDAEHRRELEERIGHALAQRDATPDRIAHHLWTGGQTEQAAPYLQRAAEHSLSVEDNLGAEELYQRLTQVAPEESSAHLGLASARLRQGLHPQACINFREAIELSRSQGDRKLEAESLLGLAKSLQSQRQTEECEEALGQAQAAFTALGDGRGRAQCLVIRGMEARAHGKYEESLSHYREALEYYDNADSLQAARIHGLMARIHLVQGDPEAALASYSRSLVTYRKLGSKRNEAASLNNAGNVLCGIARYGESIELLKDALAVRRQISDRRGVAATTVQLAYLYLVLGAHSDALDYANRAREMFETLGESGWVLRCEILCGSALSGMRDHEQAEETLSIALREATNRDEREEVIRAQFFLLTHFADTGRLDRMATLLPEFRSEIQDRKLDRFHAQALRFEALLASDPEKRRERLEAALEEARKTKLPELEWELLWRLGRLWQEENDPALARTRLEQSRGKILELATSLDDYPNLKACYLNDPRRKTVLEDAKAIDDTMSQAPTERLDLD